MLVAAPDYLRRHGVPSEPSALEGHACIGLDFQPLEDRLAFGPPAGPAARAAGAEPWLVPVRCPLRVNNSNAILATVEAGLGIGIVPDFAAAAGLRARRLKAVLPRWPLAGAYAPRVVHAVYTPTRHLPAKVRVLIDHLAAAAAAPATGRARS